MADAPVTVAVPPGTRERDIDAAKGLACLLMVFGHAAFQSGWAVHRITGWQIVSIVGETAVPLFFMAIGVNVAIGVEKSAKDRSARPTLFLLLTAVLMFVLGNAYNLNRQTVGLMDLFQGIAVMMMLAYVPLRREWPSWAVLAFGLMLCSIGLSHALVQDPSLTHGYISISADEFNKARDPAYAHGDLYAKYLALVAELKALPLVHRLLYVHFSVAPWSGFAVLGGLSYRWYRQGRERWGWALFATLFVVSLLMPYFGYHALVDFFFRGKPDYVFRQLALAGLIILALRRWYGDGAKATRWVEFLGRESFLVFITHWLFLEFIATFFPKPMQLFGVYTATMVLTGILVFGLSKLRDKTMEWKIYVPFWIVVYFGFIYLALVARYRIVTPGHLNEYLSHLLTFPAATAFAMLMPALRLLRGKKTTTEAAA